MKQKVDGAVRAISAVGLLGIFATAIIYMADLVFYPAFYGIMEAFPNASMGILNLSMTGSQITAAAAAVAVIPLMGRFSKKKILLVSTLLFAVSAIATPLVADATFVAVMRTVSGLGFGGLFPVATALIQQVYRDDPERRDRLVGIYNGAVSLAGAPNSLVGGLLAAVSWDLAFSYYWVAVPVFLLILLFVPETPPDAAGPEDSDVEAAGAQAGGSGGWDGSLPAVVASAVMLGLISLVYMACGSGYHSVIFAELGLGDASAAGSVATISCVLGFFVGLAFPAVYGRAGRWTPALIVGLTCAGIAIYVAVSASYVSILVGFTLDCCAYVLAMSYYMVHVAEVAPPEKASTAITLVSLGMTAGSFLSSYAVSAIQAVLGTELVMPVYPALLAVMAVTLAVSIVSALRSHAVVAQEA